MSSDLVVSIYNILTLLGILSSAILAYLSKRATDHNRHGIRAINEAVNGQRHALEERIVVLEGKLDEATKTATEVALHVSTMAASLALQQPRAPGTAPEK